MSREAAPVRLPLNLKPPIPTALLLAAGLGLDARFGVEILPEASMRLAVGLPLLLVAFVAIVTPEVSFYRAGTDGRFAAPTTTIVQHGLFRYSRNPMYVGFVQAYLGTVVIANAPLALVGLPLVILYLRFGVIAREERHLEASFGDEYRAYAAQVRRWV